MDRGLTEDPATYPFTQFVEPSYVPGTVQALGFHREQSSAGPSTVNNSLLSFQLLRAKSVGIISTLFLSLHIHLISKLRWL